MIFSRTEADFVEEVVQDILTKLNRESSSDLRGLVGIEKKIEKIESLLCLDSRGVCCVGMWGMGGIGKTTLADCVFQRLSSKFEASCFLKNVRENSEERDGIYKLRNKLLREILRDKDLNIDTLSIPPTTRNRLTRTKVLIVLDDVNAPEQLEVLVGCHDRFCQGSRIIITARDKGLLEHKVDHDKIYNVEGLSSDEALQLFHSQAFRNKSPTTEYAELSRKVVDYVNAIPLALKVMGSLFLGCKSKQDWEDQLNKLKRFPSEEIWKVLRVSYDGLEENEKEIFLDIACFHNNYGREYVKEFLDSRGFCGEVGIKVLIDRSMISIDEESNWIEMHDLLQEMGRAIARKQCVEESSRLFIAEDVHKVLTNNQRAATVQAISIDWSELHLRHANFQKMDQLRWLHVRYPWWERTLMDSLDLPNSLSYLYWQKYPMKSLPSNFSAQNLVELHMPLCQVTGAQLWNKDQNLSNLKVICLRDSKHLTQVPDLIRSKKIERIDLSRCESLVQIPSYFKDFDKLTHLHLGGCINLKTLPKIPCNVKFLDLSETSIKELPPSVWSHEKITEIVIRYCKDLTRLPSNNCELKVSGTFSLCGCNSFCEFSELPRNITVLDLSFTAIEELPSSIETVFGLTAIKLTYCKSLVSLPNIWKLKSLKSLDLRHCSKFKNFPEISEAIEHLEFLNLSGTMVKKVPPSIGSLVALRKLDIAECSIQEIPNDLFCLTSLQELNLSRTLIKSIPASIEQAPQLSRLSLIGCKKLKSLPKLPPLLQCLQAHGCTSLKTVSSSSTLLTQCWDEYIFSLGLHEKHIFSSCPNLDQNARRYIMADAQLRIMRMATASSKFKGEKIEQASYHSDDSDYSNDYIDELDKENFGRRSFVAIKCSGNEIPNWFSHQSEGSSINMQLSPDWFSTDFLGFALSLALENCDAENQMKIECKYNFKASNGESHEINHPLYNPFMYGSHFQDSHQVFVWYNNNVFEEVVEEARSPTAFYKLITEVSVDFKVLQFSYESLLEEEEEEELELELEVEQCGICLLYAKDAEIIKQRAL
ncbi:PREDICTED: TMV resistance protein N [Prunus mume]|uniref:ADP-ribosyl cyclase/cyclic ADP-ribose hydrolase n=1 Tax=Prunus mume TaxID=102107 RepID=A0ABM1LSV3_PRUMU|nr:PREDICTED: TMV resistance protein N [Prunus mume]